MSALAFVSLTTRSTIYWSQGITIILVFKATIFVLA